MFHAKVAYCTGHGRSSPEAVANAIRTGAEFVRKDVSRSIREAVSDRREVPAGGAAAE